MEIISILLFFVTLILLGISIKCILKIKINENIIDYLIIIIGAGLGTFLILINIFNLINIPLNFWIFLLVSLLAPIYFLVRKKFELPKIKMSLSLIYSGILLLILLGYFFFFFNGSYRYHYLEDDDPWGYAEAAKYISTHGEYDPKPTFTHYLEPYPPAYSSLMGIMHQTNSSIFETLKLFNVLLMTLTLGFFYLLCSALINKKMALIATSILALTPSFMSHFIWSQTLAIAMFMITFFFIVKFIKEKDNNDFFLSIILLAASLNIQTIASVKIGVIFFLLFISLLIMIFLRKEKIMQIKKLFLIGLIGLVLSCAIYWLPAFIHQGPEEFMKIAEGFSIFKSASSSSQGMAQYANPVYSIKDLIIAPMSSKIDQATGIGLFIFISLLIGLIFVCLKYKKLKDPLFLFLLVWFVWELVSVESGMLPIGLFAARSWVYLSIVVAIIAGYGVYCLLKSTAKIHFFVPVIIAIGLIIGFYYTSYVPKEAVQHAVWPPGVSWTSNEELQGFLTLKDLPPNTKVYSACQPQSMVIGFDKLSFPWIKEVRDYKGKIINDSIDKNYEFLKKYNYEYVVMSAGCVRDYGANETNKKINELMNDKRFNITNSNQGYILFKIS